MKRIEPILNFLCDHLVAFGQYLSLSNRRFLFILGTLLLFGISFHNIPRTTVGRHQWGIDFYNLYTYHHCEEFKDFPYQGAGDACFDSRGMVYPPLMYWLFAWVRGLSYEVSYGIVIALIILGVIIAGVCLPGERKKQSYLWIAPLLLLQFPSAFGIERGNSDVFIVFTWLGLLAAWFHGHYWLAGLLAAVAVQAKVYPAIPVGLLGLIWIYLWYKKNPNSDDTALRQKLNPFVIGFTITTVLLFIVLWEQSAFYWFKVLPYWAKQGQGRHATVHGLRSILPSVRFVGVLAAGLLGYTWLRVVYRLLLVDSVFVLTGLLAISTYFQGVSNDYNLVTAYPFFALCILRVLAGHPKKYIYAGLLPLGIISVLGYKWLWGNSVIDIVGLHIALQLIWLILMAEFHLKLDRTESDWINKNQS